MMEISCLILSYNPKLEDLISTVESCVVQKNVELEIIISDDGSNTDFFDEIRNVFLRYEFTNYKLVKNNDNRGTVWNLFGALDYCCGRWVKLLSPGDFLSGQYCLEDWIRFLDEKKCGWAYSDVYYFKKNKNIEKYIAYPQKPDLCKKTWRVRAFYYLACNNVGIGASYICECRLLKEYLPLILNEVVYADDIIFKLFMYYGILGEYFEKKMICYSLDSGISTGSSEIWTGRLQRDYCNFSKVILRQKINCYTQIQIKKIIWTDMLSNRRLAAFIKMILSPKFARYFVDLKFHRKYGRVYSFDECMLLVSKDNRRD